MMETALTYMLNVWDDLLKYRHRGDYTVDNMVAVLSRSSPKRFNI